MESGFQCRYEKLPGRLQPVGTSALPLQVEDSFCRSWVETPTSVLHSHSVESMPPGTLGAAKCTALHVLPSNKKRRHRERLFFPSPEFYYEYVAKPANRTSHFQDFCPGSTVGRDV